MFLALLIKTVLLFVVVKQISEEEKKRNKSKINKKVKDEYFECVMICGKRCIPSQ